MAKTRHWFAGLWSSRPQFLVGFFIGICLSSAAVQGVLFYLGVIGAGGQPPLTPLTPATGPAHHERLSDYEVHNLGLKLHSASEENAADSHVIKYFHEEEMLGVVDHYDSLPGLGEAGAGAAGAGSGRSVYAGVLTSRERLSDHSAVVRMTWGSELTTVQFFYDTGGERADRVRRDHTREVVGLSGVGPSDVFTPRHTVETLRHVCSRHRDAFPWFVLLRDATYVHTSGLLRMLDRLSPSEDLIIGARDSAHDGVCSASPGIIFSSRALSRVCARLDKCAESDHVEQCLGIQCVSSKKISPDLHVTSPTGSHVDVVGLLAGSRLSDQSVFVGPLSDTRDVYQLHLHYTRARIARTQHEITRLAQELSRTRRSVRPKRDRSVVRVQETAVFGGDALLNKTSDPLYQYIDQSGRLYLHTCKVRTQHVGREPLSPYREALSLARATLQGEEGGLEEEGLEYFTYKVTKPNLGVEYQFYFLQTLPAPAPAVGSRGRPPRQKVHQVTVLHPYDKLEVESKEIQEVRTVHFVVPTSAGSAEGLTRFLLNYEAVCLSGGGVNIDRGEHKGGGGDEGGGGDQRGGGGEGNGGIKDRCALLIVVYKQPKVNQDAPRSEGHTARDLEKALSAMSERYPGAIHNVLEVAGESLTLARTVQMADSAFNRDDLLAVLTPEVAFTEDFLFRCQLNARPMKRAYFPVVYQKWGDDAHSPSTYFGDPDDGDLNMEGFWANADFSTFCAYNEDIQLFDNLPSSPRDLHNMFKASEYMGVFRAPDPGLSMDWNGRVCGMSNSLDRQTCMRELKYINMQ